MVSLASTYIILYRHELYPAHMLLQLHPATVTLLKLQREPCGFTEHPTFPTHPHPCCTLVT